MTTILLCTDGSAYAQVGYQYVAWLAEHLSVEVEILYVTDQRKEQAMQTADWSGSLGIDTYQSLLTQMVELEHQASKLDRKRSKIILNTAQQVLLDSGLSPKQITLIHDTGFVVDCFHEHEQRADLVVLGKRGEAAQFAPQHLGSNMERIVRSSHKPCLVTSREFQPVTKVLLAYDGSDSCQRALHYVANTPVFRGVELHLVTVTDTHRGDDKANGLIDKTEHVLTAAGFKAILHVLHGDAETAIVDYAETQDINFIIMGSHGHRRIRTLAIGSTSTQVLRWSHCPVLLFR